MDQISDNNLSQFNSPTSIYETRTLTAYFMVGMYARLDKEAAML